MIVFRDKRTEVHCEGDVAVFGCALADDGTAWVVLGEGDQGEIGRDVPDDVAAQMVKDGKAVVLFGAQDVKSFDVLIEVFGAARDRLASQQIRRPPGHPPLPDALAVLEDRTEGACLVLRRAALLLDELLGDTDFEGDSSPEFRACQALNELLNQGSGHGK